MGNMSTYYHSANIAMEISDGKAKHYKEIWKMKNVP